MQLDLKLPMRNTSTRTARTFRTDRNGLIEDFGEVAFVYGYWDRYFGCWIHDRLVGKIHECVPDWRFLDQAGQGRSPSVLRSQKSRIRPRARVTTAADLAFFAYFQSIPHHLRRLVATLGPHQWPALDGTREDPPFADFIDTLQANSQINYLHVCFVLGGTVGRSRSERRDLAQAIRTEPRVEYLNHLSEVSGISGDTPWTERRLRILYKLDPLTSAADITRFLEITSDREIQNYAGHASRLSLDGIQVFETLHRLRPSQTRLPNIVEALSVLEDPGALNELVERAAALLPHTELLKAFNQLRSTAMYDDLLPWSWKLEEALVIHCLRGKRFPKPPINGEKRLLPLSSVDALEQEARDMRNCLRSRVLSVIQGRAYYFHWKGREEATVELSVDETGSWALSEALGRGNRRISCTTREAIEEYVLQQLEPEGQALLEDREE